MRDCVWFLWSILFLLYCSIRVLLLNKGFAHGHATSILSTEACLFHCFEAEKNSAHNHLVVDEAENMSQMRVSNFTKSYSFYDTHNNLNDVNELRYQRKHLYYFQEIQTEKSNKELLKSCN